MISISKTALRQDYYHGRCRRGRGTYFYTASDTVLPVYAGTDFEGHVYVAMPPLYKVIPSKGKEEYLYDDAALENTGKHIPEVLRCSVIKVSERWMRSSCGRLR